MLNYIFLISAGLVWIHSPKYAVSEMFSGHIVEQADGYLSQISLFNNKPTIEAGASIVGSSQGYKGPFIKSLGRGQNITNYMF